MNLLTITSTQKIMAPDMKTLIQAENYLILTFPDTEFSKYLMEVSQLSFREPEILNRIDQDLKKDARRKKKKRMKDEQWKESQNQRLPYPDEVEAKEIDSEDLKLQIGRQRMPAEIVFLFLMIRGYLGGIKSQTAQTFLQESQSLQIFLLNRGLKMPGMSTILDNINAVSNESRQFIFDAQIRMILQEELDDFTILKIDSTAVAGNTSWPTDSLIMTRLVERLVQRGSSLDKFGIDNIGKRNFDVLIKEMKKISKIIAFEVGKKGSEKKRIGHYQSLLKQAKKAYEKILKEMATVELNATEVNLVPSLKTRLIRLVEMMKEDLCHLESVMAYCSKRVFENKKTPSTEKVLSLSDQSAAFIQKGNREAVVGYKPQLGRSGNGFISVLITPEGNAADSGQLDPTVTEHFRCTRVIPHEVSTDDGYANSAIREKWLNQGVKIFSINGAKGKKMTPIEDWESEIYLESRNGRSAAESLMFHLKHSFHFGRVMRRGIENVRAELLEKALAYNFCRTLELRNRKLKQAA